MIDDILAELEADTALDTGARFTAVTARYFERTARAEGQVSTPLSHEELARRFAGPMPRKGKPVEEVIALLERDVIADANQYCHPMYMGHQTSAPLPAGVWTETIISALNQSLAVAEMSPTATAMEHQVIRWMSDLAGYPSSSGGTLTSGGTEANFTAMLAARNAALPEAWENGVGADPPFVVHGEHAHYAVTRAIGQLGMGKRRGVAVASKEFRMDVAALERTLDELRIAGSRVMAVVATAGSTATGSFDDLNAIGQICGEREIWLHVDAAHGASALLSRNPPPALNGLKLSRSLAWDPHKGLLLPLAAGMVMVRNEEDLGRAFAQQAPYLFHAGSAERVPDQGVRSFQCSRRADVIKLWVALHRYGSDGLGALYDHVCGTARTLFEMIETSEDFEALHEPESNILCFRYLGAAGKRPGAAAGSVDAQRIDELNRALRRSYNTHGTGWITATVLSGRPVLRVTMMNARTGREHVKALLEGLRREAGSLS